MSDDSSDDDEWPLGSLLHDGELVSATRAPEAITLALRPGVGELPDGPVFTAHFAGLRECSVHADELPGPPPPDPTDQGARDAWFARAYRRSLDWIAFETALSPSSRLWFEILEAKLVRPLGPIVALELYGRLAPKPPFDARQAREDQWRWVTVRAASVTWARMDGTAIDLDWAVGLSMVWWAHWSSGSRTGSSA